MYLHGSLVLYDGNLFCIYQMKHSLVKLRKNQKNYPRHSITLHVDVK